LKLINSLHLLNQNNFIPLKHYEYPTLDQLVHHKTYWLSRVSDVGTIRQRRNFDTDLNNKSLSTIHMKILLIKWEESEGILVLQNHNITFFFFFFFFFFF